MRLYAVGDIHGRLDLLTRLLAMIEADALAHPTKEKIIIFLGDYIDRGLDSRGVLERLSGSFVQGLMPIFLRGNHDEMFLRFLKGQTALTATWLSLGGLTTLASYGVRAPMVLNEKALKTLIVETRKKVPPAHKDFLEQTLLNVIFGDYYFVHAGAHPDKPLETQTLRDKLTIREPFLSSYKDFGKVIVHGHTIEAKPALHKHRIGLDTGAFATGRLTALVLDGATQHFITT